MTKNDAVLICNGEIQNQRELAEEYGFVCSSGSDCEVILDLHRRFYDPTDPRSVSSYLRLLKGVWACILVDLKEGVVVVSRDRFGVRPLFQGQSYSGETYAFSSLLKGIPRPLRGAAMQFSPSTFSVFSDKGPILVEEAYYSLGAAGVGVNPGVEIPPASAFEKNVVDKLRMAVRRRMMADVPIGCLLSGGLDSSVVAAFVVREWVAAGGRAEDIHTFSIAMRGGTDLEYAAEVARALGTTHHVQEYRREDFLAAIPDVVRATETWDLTTIRASVGNWLIGRRIREETGVRVVFNGDGADEVCGGQMYFWLAPDDAAFDTECRRLLGQIHYQDVLRSDRGMADNDLEARTPFLDHEFVEAQLAVPAVYRKPEWAGCTKGFLRRAIWNCMGGEDFLPGRVLWRAKEAFSDGVSAIGETWADSCESQATKYVGDDFDMQAWAGCPIPGGRKEGVFQVVLFLETFGEDCLDIIPGYWMPQWSDAVDPSARVLTCQEAGRDGERRG